MSGTVIADLVVLTPGKDEEAALHGLFARHAALQVHRPRYVIYRHQDRDAGCRLDAANYLRSFASQYRHALVLFDHEGCGAEQVPAEQIEATVEQELAAAGWAGRASCVVIAPELENWLWSDSPHVADVLGWAGQAPSLRHWLYRQGYLAPGAAKPARPKETAEAAMRVVRKHRTSLLYRQLAERVSLEHCADRAFLKLKGVLREWFAIPERTGG